ncbi:ParB/RepB/Spo0J family partition protein [Azospirillum griseum]|uniref:ParB/RepB/Spo0J family partition protein n=1 Tax=Azospirillum griseum TaxID=2496639 RepID=A0A431V9W2_9PROT|nr:ParB/RepB/Spo0J family partition protein [Azospirillum griseum]RTR12745.1 ParB/RepB/Spo0J family partition protein [Azospirillum griseum]
MSRKLGRTNSAMLGALREGRENKPVGESALPVSFQNRNGRTAQVEVDSIATNPDQPRRDFDKAELTALTESIERYGLLEPIGVKPLPNGLYQLAYGERRLRAVRALGQPTVTAVVLDADAPADEIALVENLLRSDLSPFEVADGFARIMETRGWSQGDISRHLGIAKSEVSRTLKVLDLPARIRAEYLQVQVPMRVLRDIAALKDDAAQTAAWESAKRTYAGAEVESGEGVKAPKTKARRPSEDPAEIAHSTLPKRIARSVLTTRDALVLLRTEPTGKPLADTDRTLLREMRDAIDALLMDEAVG